MFGPTSKFFGTRGGPGTEHKGNLHWPGTAEGFPVRTYGEGLPNLRQEEFEDLPKILDYHSQRFLLWLPEEKAAFDIIMDRIANGWYSLSRRIDRWSDQNLGLAVWLEWVQIYGEVPQSKSPGANSHVHQPNQPQRAFPPAQNSQLASTSYEWYGADR